MNPPVQATVPKDPEKDLEIEPFSSHLVRLGLRLTRQTTTTLQINLGFLCNQRCLHCHHEAGPDRREVMDSKTMEDVVAYAGRARFQTIDLTGGAPEMNPLLPDLIQRTEISSAS
jgi:molybdenum cofactor biosynthesis enzyme MoaA